MPISSYSQLRALLATRAAPTCRAGSDERLEGYGDDRASIRAFGLDVVTDLCAGLLARGAPGLHFYTLNQAPLTDDDLAAPPPDLT